MADVKLRRAAAALTLVGWYLMVPPMHESGFWSRFGMRFGDTNAPLSRWSIVGTFNTVRECEAALSERTARQREARCVASDDSRLKR
jgi:hypothetical protein